MVCILNCLGWQWVKLGFTEQRNPWNRVVHNELLANAHQKQIFGEVAFENLEILHVHEGGENLEEAIQSLFPSNKGHFWLDQDLDDIAFLLKLCTTKYESMPKPNWCVTESNDKLACCNGVWPKSWWKGVYKRSCKVLQNKLDVHEVCKCSCVWSKVSTRGTFR